MLKKLREAADTFVLDISAQTNINRLDFGVGKNWQHSLIPNFIGTEVSIEIDMWTKPGKRPQ